MSDPCSSEPAFKRRRLDEHRSPGIRTMMEVLAESGPDLSHADEATGCLLLHAAKGGVVSDNRLVAHRLGIVCTRLGVTLDKMAQLEQRLAATTAESRACVEALAGGRRAVVESTAPKRHGTPVMWSYDAAGDDASDDGVALISKRCKALLSSAQQLDSLLAACETALQSTREDLVVAKSHGEKSSTSEAPAKPAEQRGPPTSLASLVPAEHHLHAFLVDSAFFRTDPFVVRGDVSVGLARSMYVHFSQQQASAAKTVVLDHCQFPTLMTALLGRLGVKPARYRHLFLTAEGRAAAASAAAARKHPRSSPTAEQGALSCAL